MEITFSQEENHLTLTSKLSESDRKVAGKATLERNSARFSLPKDFSLDNTHPDLLALAALITFYPWIGKELYLPFPVSVGFAETVRKVSKIDVSRTSAWIPKRVPTATARPGISFSGGVDSMAALALMPENTQPVFTLRTPPPSGGRTLYKPDVALYAIEEMKSAGKVVHVVETNHEWVREPVGFSVDPAPGIPLMLLADYLDLDAIAYGTIAESAYVTGQGKWAEYKDRVVFTRWGSLFAAVGLPSYMPTAGVSEIGSSTIVQTSRFGYLAQSCIRGIPGKPCRACVKCFRKSLITASLTKEWPDPDEVSRMMANKTIRGFLEKEPIRFEIILTRVMADYDGKDPLLLALQKRLESKNQDVAFTDGWYPESMKLVPEKYRAVTIDSVCSYLPRMTTDQVEKFEHYDLQESMSKMNVDQNEWLETLEANAQQVLKQSKK